MDKKELLETALHYLYELEGEWRWRRRALKRQRDEYEELVQFVDEFRDLISKKDE